LPVKPAVGGAKNSMQQHHQKSLLQDSHFGNYEDFNIS
jgi:hypothetical protein